MNTPTDYPAACRDCGIYSRCTADSAFAQPLYGGSTNLLDPLVLVVVSGYHPDVVNTDTPGGDLLLTFLDSLEATRWAVMGTLRCRPSVAKPDKRFHRLCVMEHVPAFQLSHAPDVVMLMGQEAMECGLGKFAPKSIRHATRKTITVIDGAAPVVIGRSPWAHRPEEGESLLDEWMELFARAEALAHKRTQQADFPYEEVSNIPEAIKIAQQLPREFIFDPEYGAHENDPARRTYWHPGADLLCWSVEWVDQTGVSRTACFTPPVAKDKRLWEAVFRGRTPGAHFAKNDLQVPYAMLGLDVFPLINRLPTGEIEFRDPGCEIHLCDQSRAGLGILSLVMDNYGAANWKQKKDDMILAANKRLDADWKQYLDWKQRRGSEWRAYRKWKQKEDERDLRLSILQNPDAHPPARVRAAQRWLDKNPAWEVVEPPPAPPLPERPRGTCGYEAAIPYLYRYCAEDSWHTGRVLREVVPNEIAKLGGSGPLVRRLLARITEMTCMVERIGLPVDMQRVEAATQLFRQAEIDAKSALLATDPRVAEAVANQRRYHQELERNGGDVRAAALRYLNPGSPLFRLEFARVLGVDIEEHRQKYHTKTGAPSFSKTALTVLSGKGPWELATPEQKAWRAFGQLKSCSDLISKLGMFRWQVDGYVRTDYRIVKVDMADHGGAGEGDSSGTETGRLSAGYLQGLKKDPAFRSLFVAPPGWVFLESDYSTLEPRVLAYLANIQEWFIWFQRKLDMYCGMANRMYGLGVDLDGPDQKAVAELLRACITDPERQVMKRCFLAQMYMQGVTSLAEAAGIPLDKAQEFADFFHRSYPQLKKLQGQLWSAMMEGRPIVTPFGRQAYAHLPHEHDPDKDRKLAELHRHFWNMPTQGTGSDICLWLGWEFMRELQAIGAWGGPNSGNPNSWGGVCNVVHDAWWSLVREDKFEQYARLKAKVMQDRSRLPFKFPVPLDIEMKAGRELSNLKHVDIDNPKIPKE